MRILQRFFFVSLAVLAATDVHAQSSTINGPLLGFTAALGGTAIEPIMGVPGASTLASPLPLDAAFPVHSLLRRRITPLLSGL